MIVRTPWNTANPAPSTRVPVAASRAHRYAALPCPNGWSASAGRDPRRSATKSSTSVSVSAKECAASESTAADPLSTPATALATAMARLARPATMTVPVLSGRSGSFTLFTLGRGRLRAVPYRGPVRDPSISRFAAARLSPDRREADLLRLRHDRFDVVIVGGGVTGAGAALDAASRGLSVALVEARDLASGTSSRSSKLVHGGLRYLEQFDLGLVHEALQERGLLATRLAPHLVRPMPFLHPVAARSAGTAACCAATTAPGSPSTTRSPGSPATGAACRCTAT